MEKKKIAFICGAYRNKSHFQMLENINKARTAALDLWERNFVVICPHLNSQFMSGEFDEQIFLDGYLQLIEVSDVIFVLDNYRDSSGSKAEIKHAQKLGIKVVAYKEK